MTLLQQEQEQEQSQHKNIKNTTTGTRDTTIGTTRDTPTMTTPTMTTPTLITIQNKKIMSILYPNHNDNDDDLLSSLPKYNVEMIDELVHCLLSHSSLVFKTIEGRGLFKAAEKAPLIYVHNDESVHNEESDIATVEDQNQNGDYTGYDNVWVRSGCDS